MDDVDYVDEGVESSEATSESAEGEPPVEAADPKAKARPAAPVGAVCKREARPPRASEGPGGAPAPEATEPSAAGEAPAAREAPVRDTAPRDPPAREAPVREVSAREAPARDAPPGDPPARDAGGARSGGAEASGRPPATEPRARRNTRPPAREEDSDSERGRARARNASRGSTACWYCWQMCHGGIAGLEQHQRDSQTCREWRQWYRATGTTPEQWMQGRAPQQRRYDSYASWDVPGKGHGRSSSAHPAAPPRVMQTSWEDSVRALTPPRASSRREGPRSPLPKRRRERTARSRSPHERRGPPPEPSGPPSRPKRTEPPTEIPREKKKEKKAKKKRPAARPSPTPSLDRRRRRRSPSGLDRDGPPAQPKFTVVQRDAKSFVITMA